MCAGSRRKAVNRLLKAVYCILWSEALPPPRCIRLKYPFLVEINEYLQIKVGIFVRIWSF